MTRPPSPRPTAADPAGSAVDPREPGPKEPAPDKPQLSLTQVLASALAAITTTVLLSSFGIAGTIIGAAVASVATVVGNYAYTRSIDRTRAQLRPVVVQIAKPNGTTTRPRGDAVDAATTTAVTRGTVEGVDARVTGGSVDISGVEATAAPGRRPWFRLMDRYGKGRVLTVTALVLFVLVMGVVLVVELVIGKPLSDAVRGQDGSGTSISRSSWTSDDGTTDPSREVPGDEAPAPADDPADVPSDDTTDAPAPEPSDRPTGDDPTEQPTDEPTEQPTDEPTEQPSDGSDGTDGGTIEDPDGADDTAEGSGPNGPGAGGSGSADPGSTPDGETSGGTGTEPTPAPTRQGLER